MQWDELYQALGHFADRGGGTQFSVRFEERVVNINQFGVWERLCEHGYRTWQRAHTDSDTEMFSLKLNSWCRGRQAGRQAGGRAGN